MPESPRNRRQLVGYGMVFAAATLFGINGTFSKVTLASGSRPSA